MELTHSPKTRVFALAACAALVSACATAGGTTASPTAGGTTTTAPTPVPQVRWPVKTSAHFDLWLHSFGILTLDTTAIPLFKRGYRDSINVVKRRGNVLTSLDANRQPLVNRLSANPALVQAQFLVFEFASLADLQKATASFLQAQGEPSRAPDQATASDIARLAPIFPTAADREWLRVFMLGVADENARFYDAEYQRVLRARSAVVSEIGRAHV